VLDTYFNPGLVDAALQSYGEQARARDWAVAEKLRLYNLAKSAFERGSEAGFAEIHAAMRSWKAFRGAADGVYWSPDEAFRGLQRCSQVGRASPITLLNLDGSEAFQQDVRMALRSVRGLKALRTANYPWMAASKFLHFFNPALFPIYDTAAVWGTVLDGSFKKYYRAFCRQRRLAPGENSEEFNLNYGLLASEILRSTQADEVMEVFAGWFRRETSGAPDPNGVLDDLKSYYATAFEFIAIGAAALERPTFLG
jgi:hypothetical protein